MKQESTGPNTGICCSTSRWAWQQSLCSRWLVLRHADSMAPSPCSYLQHRTAAFSWLRPAHVRKTKSIKEKTLNIQVYVSTPKVSKSVHFFPCCLSLFPCLIQCCFSDPGLNLSQVVCCGSSYQPTFLSAWRQRPQTHQTKYTERENSIQN